MSSAERARVATKAGWFADGRNEAGVMFDQAGAPVLTYAMFATHPDQQDNYGATHPLVQARARMGRRFLDATAALSGPPAESVELTAHQPYNGG